MDQFDNAKWRMIGKMALKAAFSVAVFLCLFGVNNIGKTLAGFAPTVRCIERPFMGDSRHAHAGAQGPLLRQPV